jgi:hypothetical protein
MLILTATLSLFLELAAIAGLALVLTFMVKTVVSLFR